MAEAPKPAIATTAPTGDALASPQPVYLSPEDQAAILHSMGLDGWQVVSGIAVPDVEVATDPLSSTGPKLTSKGTYSISVRDPSKPQQEGEKVAIRKTTDPSGSPGWAVESPAPAPQGKPTAATQKPASVGDANTGYWALNKATDQYELAVPPKTPNADEEMKKALDRYDAEDARRRRAANETATGIYGTDEEVAKIKNDAATQGLNRDTLNQRIAEFNVTSKQKDTEQAAKDKVDAQNILQSKAQTTKIGAETGGVEATTKQTLSATDINQRKAGPEIAGIEATTEASKAQTERNRQLIAQGKAPTVETPQTGMYVFKRNPDTGETTQEFNPAYVPKTSAEIQARVGQIQTMANAKQAELNSKLSDTYKPEQAYSDFQKWWGDNVTPHEGALKAAQQDADLQIAKDQAAMRTAAYTAANTAGKQYTDAFTAENAARVGPRFDEVMNQIRQSGGDLSKVDTKDAFTYTAPRPTMAGPQAVNEALKYLDPTAAAAAGAPPPNPQALAAQARPMLDRSQYQFGATAPPAPAPPPPAGVPPAPPPPEPTVPPPGSPGLLPAGVAGVGGFPGQAADPRYAGANPMAGVPMPDWLQGGAPPPPPVQAMPAGMPGSPGMPPGPRMPSWSSYGYVPPDYSYQ